MPLPLRLLLVEAVADDALLVVRELRRSGYEPTWERLDNAAALVAALAREPWDVITCDWIMPEFSALEAMAILKEHGVDAPIIIVSGEVGEEVGVTTMKAGAHDFVSKHQLTRLVPAIERELRAAEERRARKRAEQTLSERLDFVAIGAKAAFWDWDLRAGSTQYAPSWLRLLQYAENEVPMRPQQWLALIHPDDRDRFVRYVRHYVVNPSPPYEIEFRVRHKDGAYRWLLSRAVSINAEDGRVARMVGLHVDITERKRREEENAALIEVARALGGTLDLGELLARVQRCVAQVLPCDFVVTFAWDPARSVFRNVSHYGVAPELVAEVERAEYPMDDAIRKQLRRETLVVNDITKQDLLPVESFAAFHISALMATPLAVHGRPFDNALVAYATTPGARFDERQVELFEAIGRQLGVAMEAAELYRVQKEEAEVSAGLAKVGQDLISSLDRPDMLDRLCRLTTELLGCDTSHTMLWQPRDDVYAGVAGYGYQPEEWNVLRAMKLPRARLLGLLKQLANASATQGLIRTPSDPLWRSLGQQLGVASTLITALRHGADVIGLQVACYRRVEQSFSLQQERLARGIATLASLALQHARLVDELERANRIKSEFLATMSHELRTPLNVLIGYNDLLLSEEFGPLAEAQRETLRYMDRSARQLHELINAILDLSRLEADQAPLELSDLSVSDLIRELEEETLQTRAQANLQFTWRVLPEVPRLRTDAIKLKVILKNLIANAVKFTRQGSITVVARVRDAGVEFSVTDTGIGIAPYVLPTIFEPFRQGDSSTTRSYGGIGLGLYVVRRLLELLGGSVTAESEVGRGSTFRVWVPTAGIATVENAAAG